MKHISKINSNYDLTFVKKNSKMIRIDEIWVYFCIWLLSISKGIYGILTLNLLVSVIPI